MGLKKLEFIFTLLKKVIWRFRKILLVGFSVFLVFITLRFIEISLRMKGKLPGMIGKVAHFGAVDSLEVRDDYRTDEAGIMSMSEQKTKLILDFIHSQQSAGAIDSLWKSREIEYTVKLVARGFYYLSHFPDSLSGEFGERILSFRNQSRPSATDSLCYSLLSAPVNPEGFRSIPFTPDFTHRSRKKILLLGDSFTWGVSANPITSSFADILLARGYIVYNSGIVGADPAQYLAIAEKWIPVLKPDVVVVNFFMGNDQMHYHRKSEYQKPAYHATNAGWLWAVPKGCWLDANTAYENLKNEETIPEQEKYAFNRWCAKTVLGTKLWSLLRGAGIAKGTKAADRIPCDEQYQNDPISEEYLEKIDVICQANSARMLNRVIPDYKISAEQTRKEAAQNFGHLPYIVPSDLSYLDYIPEPDGHFNNAGHLKYANGLQREIDSLLAEQEKKF